MRRIIWFGIGIVVAIVIFVFFPNSWNTLVSFFRWVWGTLVDLVPSNITSNLSGYGYS